MHKVSVVIATKNEEKNLERCLKSLAAQPQKCEVIVVDNFSTDKTVDIAKKYTKNVFLKGPERSAQRNFGLKKALGQFVLFLDADMELTKNIIKESVDNFKKGTAGIIIDEISTGKNFLSKIKSLEKKLYQNVEELEAARFFRRKDLLKIGGFDKNLISGEDWDLTLRIKKIGKLSKIKSRILHYENQSILKDILKKYYYALHISKYAKKHPQEFKNQASIKTRIAILFKNPHLIRKHPWEFTGLLILKLLHSFAYYAAISKLKLL